MREGMGMEMGMGRPPEQPPQEQPKEAANDAGGKKEKKKKKPSGLKDFRQMSEDDMAEAVLDVDEKKADKFLKSLKVSETETAEMSLEDKQIRVFELLRAEAEASAAMEAEDQPSAEQLSPKERDDMEWSVLNRVFKGLNTMTDEQVQGAIKKMSAAEVSNLLHRVGVPKSAFQRLHETERRQMVLGAARRQKSLHAGAEARPEESENALETVDEALLRERPKYEPPDNLPLIPEEGEAAPSVAPPSSDLEAQSGVFETRKTEPEVIADSVPVPAKVLKVPRPRARKAKPAETSGVESVRSVAPEAAPETVRDTEDVIEVQDSDLITDDEPTPEQRAQAKQEKLQQTLKDAEQYFDRLRELGIDNPKEYVEKYPETYKLRMKKFAMDEARNRMVAAESSHEKMDKRAWLPKWLGGPTPEKTAAAQAELAAAENAYEALRADYVGERLYRKNLELAKIADRRGEELLKEKDLGAVSRDILKSMADQNLGKWLNWEPKGRIGKAIARGVNARTLVAAGLVGGGAVMGGGALAISMTLAGRGIRGAAAGVGAYDLGRQFRERQKDVTQEEADNMETTELLERMATLQARAAMGGRKVMGNDEFLTLRQALTRKQERANEAKLADTSQRGELVSALSYLESKDIARAKEEETRKNRWLKAGAAAFGVAAGSGVIAKGVSAGYGAVKEFFFGSGEPPVEGVIAVAPAGEPATGTDGEITMDPLHVEGARPEATAELSEQESAQLALAEVRKGDGYARIISRQLSADPKRFGYDATTDGDAKKWIAKKVGEIVRRNGLAGDGAEMRLRYVESSPSFVMLKEDLSIVKGNVDQYSVVAHGEAPAANLPAGTEEPTAWPPKAMEMPTETIAVTAPEAAPAAPVPEGEPEGMPQMDPDTLAAIEKARETIRQITPKEQLKTDYDVAALGLAGGEVAGKVEAIEPKVAVELGSDAAEDVANRAATGEPITFSNYLGQGSVKFEHAGSRVTNVEIAMAGRINPESILKSDWPGIAEEHTKENVADFMLDVRVQGDAREVIMARRVLKILIDKGLKGPELDYMKFYVKARETQLIKEYGDILK